MPLVLKFPLVFSDFNPDEDNDSIEEEEEEKTEMEDISGKAPVTKGPLRCSIGSKLCRDGTDCVLYNHVCDGENDCEDGSDEDECSVVCESGEETTWQHPGSHSQHALKCILTWLEIIF